MGNEFTLERMVHVTLVRFDFATNRANSMGSGFTELFFTNFDINKPSWWLFFKVNWSQWSLLALTLVLNKDTLNLVKFTIYFAWWICIVLLRILPIVWNINNHKLLEHESSYHFNLSSKPLFYDYIHDWLACL